MINEIDAIQKHLGIRIGQGQLNHYTLLGLDQDASQKDIKQALRTAVAAWNDSETKSNPSSAQHVAKLIKQAQAVLLDESKKRVFDAGLTQMDSPNNRLPLSDANPYPDADPFAKFDLNECSIAAKSNQFIADFGNAEARWNELSRRIPTLQQVYSNPVSAPLAISQSASADSPQIDYAQKGESAAQKFERLKRKRRLWQAMYLAAFVTVAAGFLVYAGIQFILNRQQIAKRIESNTEGPVMKSTTVHGTTPKSIGGNLASKVQGNASGLVLPTLAKVDNSDETNREITESNPFGNALVPESMPKTAVPPSETSRSNTMASDPKPVVPNLMANSKTAWTSAMKSAREAVEKADFKNFHRYMELALPLSADDEMKDKQARLDQLGQLYEIFIKAVHDAKSKMRGTETLSVGKNLINIVEIKNDELIVRIQGNTEHYAWDRLPPGIATAMADFSLSDQEPTDIAARAVYFSLSPARNELFSNKVKEWFEKSVGKGSVRKDLVQALTDTYE